MGVHTLVELSVRISAWISVKLGCPCRINRATTDIRSKPRSYIRSIDIRTDIRLDIGVTNIRARGLLWISVVARIIRHGHP